MESTCRHACACAGETRDAPELRPREPQTCMWLRAAAEDKQSRCSTVERAQRIALAFTSCTQGVRHLLMLPELQVRAWALLLRLGRGRQLLLRSLQDVGRWRRGRRLVPGVDCRGRWQLRVHLAGRRLLLLPQLLRRGSLPGLACLSGGCHSPLSCRAQASTCLMGAWLWMQACRLGRWLGGALQRPRQGRLRGAELQGRAGGL